MVRMMRLLDTTNAAAFFDWLKGKRVAVCGIGSNNPPVVLQFLRCGAKVAACDRRSREQIGETADRLEAIEGMVPDAGNMPAGCPFHPRCPQACDRCREECPQLRTLADGRQVRCFLAGEEGDC